ncbi:hypothetical protein LSH36_867g00050 [Paralvinella palmiformis]|uniref:Uncharacterized protein n=1 Tax=Paralvinella palmiformis TaxID=53620 RepID=A0AAD9IZG0_9ANNE|nr:hypothetical protein LSH36_867g00050 [Paralvinella palmiformis]
MAVGENELEVTGTGHSKPTTPTSEGGEGNVAESEADTIDPDKSSMDALGTDPQATDDSLGTDDDIEKAEKEPLAGPSGNNKKASAGYVSDDDVILDKSQDGDDKSDPLCTEDFESQVSEVPGQKKAWDVRCVVIGVLILLIMVAGAAAAVIAHRFKGPPLYDFQFGSMFADGMVLQRAPHRAVVWGYGPLLLKENTSVRLNITGNGMMREYWTHVKNTVGGHIWKFVLDEIEESGPFRIVATLEVESPHVISLNDVLFGDIWVCAGQFDMQFTLNQLYNTSEAESLPLLRVFGLTAYKSNVPRFDLRHIQIPWTSLSELDTAYQAYFPELCYLYGKRLQQKMGYPIGLVAMTFSDSIIEEWAPHHTLRDCGLSPRDSSSTVWHGMVYPMLNMAFYGAIWYQGELDAIHLTSMFNCTFIGFIDQWRNYSFRHTHGATDITFPIGIIQLPPNRTSEHYTYRSFTDIRWAQTANYGRMPNEVMKKMYLAATIDLPQNSTEIIDGQDPKPIIVDRLFRGIAYRQKNVTYQGPYPVGYRVKTSDSTLMLYLGHGNGHIDKKIDSGFEVCCSDNPANLCLASFTKTTYAPGREWLPAPIVKHTGTSVTISWRTCQGRHLVGVRYAWRDTPCEWQNCAIYDKFSKLPMLPYIKQRLHADGNKHPLVLEQINLF